MAPAIDAFLRRTDDRRGRIYRIGRNRSFGRHQCRKAARGKGTDRFAAVNGAGSALALHHGSGAQAISADERQLRLDSFVAGKGSWKSQEGNAGAAGAGGYGRLDRRCNEADRNSFLQTHNEPGDDLGAMNGKRLAAIDIGTNTILCLIVELANDGRFKVLDDLAEITRLGEGLDRSGRIDPEAERRSLDVLRRYLDRCSELGVEEFVAAGTSALRDAKNSSEVRGRMKQQLGLEVRVLSGEQEAAYSYLAVQRGLTLSDKELLVIDIGGGRTELILGKENRVYRFRRLDVGSVRLRERVLHSDAARGEGC